MLKPAQLYEEELKQKLIECQYKPEYKYYFSGGAYAISLPDNNEKRHDLVHLDKDDNIDGYFSYQIDWQSKSLYNFGLIGFKNNNARFIRECLANVEGMIVQGIRRCEFWAWANNEKANRLYRRLITEYGGGCSGHLHGSGFFDGKYQDSNIYEIIFDKEE